MSIVRVDTIADKYGTGPVNLYKQSAFKVWANLNGTGTIALRDSFNVSTVIDNTTGDYTYNYVNGMKDANYSGFVTLTRGNRVITHHDIIVTSGLTNMSWRSTCSDTPNIASVGVSNTDTSRHLFQAVGDLS